MGKIIAEQRCTMGKCHTNQPEVPVSRDDERQGQRRRYWLWVTRPAYYLEEDGADSEQLNPAAEDVGGWWTCHKDTQEGDLVLLWRTQPRSDIGYLIEATSDAYFIGDDPDAAEKGWDYGCEYRPRFKFANPLTLAEIRADAYLDDWSALRRTFRGRVFELTPEVWARLTSGHLAPSNPGLQKALGGSGGLLKLGRSERELEDHLEKHLGLLRRHGYDVELKERQHILRGQGGRIDLLCYEKTAQRYLVIELKNVRASRNTIGQVASYLGWVNEHSRSRRKARGLVIARGFDSTFLSAAAAIPSVGYLTLKELGLE